MSFADTFETPVSIEIAGRKVDIPLNTTRDYLAWLDELTQKTREAERAMIPQTTKPIDRFKMLRNIEANEAVPDDLATLVFTGKGTIRVLEIALKKARVTDEEAAKFIDSRPAKENEMLAVKVSGLFSRQRIASMYMIPEEAAAQAAANPQAQQQQATFAGANPANPSQAA